MANGGLDQLVHLGWPDGRHANLRRLVCDLIEEYGRHTGHADLLREAVDGRVGEAPPVPGVLIDENCALDETERSGTVRVHEGVPTLLEVEIGGGRPVPSGVELFGNLETMTGASTGEKTRRTLRQLSGEGLYRFASNKLYLGGRANSVHGQLAGISNDSGRMPAGVSSWV